MTSPAPDTEIDGKVSFFNLVNEALALKQQAEQLSDRLRQYKVENTNANGDFTGHPPREQVGGG